MLSLASSNERLALELALLTPGYAGPFKPWAPELALVAQRLQAREADSLEARARAQRRADVARRRAASLLHGELAESAPAEDKRAVLSRMETEARRAAGAFDARRVALEAERVRSLEMALQAFCTIAFHGGRFAELRTRYDDGGHRPTHEPAGHAEPLLQALARVAAAVPAAEPLRKRGGVLPALHIVTDSPPARKPLDAARAASAQAPSPPALGARAALGLPDLGGRGGGLRPLTSPSGATRGGVQGLASVVVPQLAAAVSPRAAPPRIAVTM